MLRKWLIRRKIRTLQIAYLSGGNEPMVMVSMLKNGRATSVTYLHTGKARSVIEALHLAITKSEQEWMDNRENAG